MFDKPNNVICNLLSSRPDNADVRFITCGSVDDGKSTLIGRLLYGTKNIYDDQLRSLEADSKQYGSQGGNIDFALLLDGLQAEREQGITIDVAYRFFATEKRHYRVADTPGHEQYTCNMATGASTAQLAIILIDARKGILAQTQRHSRIVDMMGIKHVVLAVNKMDLVAYDQQVYQQIECDYRQSVLYSGFYTIQAIPLSALNGDNVIINQGRMPWYAGPTLLEYLDAVQFDDKQCHNCFRMPVQWVNRPNQDFRGYCGRIVAGSVLPYDRVKILPSGIITQIKHIVTWKGHQDIAHAGDSITLTFTDEVDVSRGDVVVTADNPPEVADQFEARILWMSEHPLVAGRTYLFKLHTQEVTATVTAIKYQEDITNGAHLATRNLGLNGIGVINIYTSRPVVFEPYKVSRVLGGFILVDRLTYETVGAGMINFALRRASNIHWQTIEVNKQSHAVLKHQKPCCIWFTGLSGSGKSTIANLLEKKLHADGKHTYILDGDNVRHGLNRDLGFTEADRVENIRRVSEVAKLMVDAGLIVLVSFISPFLAERQMARQMFEPDEFMEVFVDTPLEECERRDVKGLYAKARRGELKYFTGIDSPYEPPFCAEIILDTSMLTQEESVRLILEHINL